MNEIKEITPQGMFEDLMDMLASKMAGYKPSLTMLFEELLNYLMLKEREKFLAENQNDKANGFYERSLALSFAKLNLKVPRVRSGNSFRPSLLPPPWKRINKDYEELLLAFLLNGYKEEEIKRSLRALKLPFSKEALDNVLDLVREKLQAFLTQPLPSEWFAVFIDAFHAKMRTQNGQIKKITLFSAVGIDMTGFKHFLGYWIYIGSESLKFWTDVLKSLISRGLTRVLIFVTDDFSGLREVIRKLFPCAHHQLCLTHFRRNLKKDLSKELYQQVKEKLEQLKIAQSVSEGEEIIMEIADLVEKEKPKKAREIREKAANYTAFLNYPKKVRKHIYTTNPVEGLNRGLELMRLELGGYFPSQECLEVNLFVQAVNLADKWQRRPIPTVASMQHELRQLFVLRYESEEV